MTSPQKQKGDRAERQFVNHLNAHGFTHARRSKAGAEKDMGDISGVVDRDGDLWCIQVANRRWRSHGEIEAKAHEAADQAEQLGAPLWCLVAKRPGCADPADWFVWLPAWALYGHTDDTAHFAVVRHDPWTDLACVTVRVWTALVAPTARQAAA